MSVKYRDYYDIMGISRDSSQDQVRKRYRELARKYHPDVNPGNKSAEEKFKDLQEAYAVLSDPKKRKRYDQLGSDWQQGADFTPPPGWGSGRVEFSDLGDLGDIFGSSGGFSEFFQSMFGNLGGGFRAGRSATGSRSSRGSDIEAEIELSLEDVHRGTQPTITLQTYSVCPGCRGRGIQGRKRCPQCQGNGQIVKPKSMTVKISPGARNNSVVRLSGKGTRTSPSGKAGDLYLRIKIRPHPRFKIVANNDLQIDLPITPWEAALGFKTPVPTLDGSVEVVIPPGTQGGTRLRLKGQGLRIRSGGRGDQYVRIRIVLPTSLSREERQLFQQLAKASRFDPRTKK
jgi:DnaJ-class molecular chaperone